MAVFTPLTLDEASRITCAHDLGPTEHITPIPAGSVNSNFFVEGAFGRRFLRIYEEQERDGVAYEWALLEHLDAAGLPIPRRVSGTEPGAERVAGKPTALFELVFGEEVCQRMVTPARAAAVGAFLGRTHRAQESFSIRREGRFQRADLRRRLDEAERAHDPSLTAPIASLRVTLDELDRSEPDGLPTGVIHGDLFRDNVRFEATDGVVGDAIVAAVDWESASDGVLAYDLMVAMLAWSFGDDFDFDLARAMVRAYDAVRPLEPAEWMALRALAIGASARFAVTRITDFHLRQGVGDRTHKDFRRFTARIEALRGLDADALATALGRP
jgi:homoserine kinase type II